MTPAMPSGWRVLAAFWAVVVLAGGAGAATLAILGPPSNRPVAPPTSEPSQTPAPAEPASPRPTSGGPARPEPARPDLARPGPARPEPAAPEPAAAHPAATQPATAPPVEAPPAVTPPPAAPATTAHADAAPPAGAAMPPEPRLPRHLYAASPVAVPAGAPRVALLLSGLGLTERDSRAAIDQLPAPVSFAVSAYASGASQLLDAARQAGHELLASIPMEPQNYPQNDEGSRSLRTGATPDENSRNLDWALGRLPGAVGATGASDGLRGERFADIPAAYNPMVDEVVRRGLLYIDPRPGRAATPGTPVRAIDVVLDEQLGRAEIDAKLSALERVAKERGGALGLAGPLRPATIERIAAWTKALPGRGLVLVPVSELINP